MEETRKAACYHGEDRISSLPDSLIHHIMSYNDTKYAVQTCVLSKRWMNVWKSLPFLNFYRSSYSRGNTKRFIEFVYMVFMFRDDTDIQKFRVDWENSAFDSTVIMNVNRWSLYAVKYNVQEMLIQIGQCHNSAYEIPHQLLNCKSLRKLTIDVFETPRYIDIILPRSMNLPQLKELFLYGLSISDVESSKRLFSSCPVLEDLLISECDIRTDNQRNFIVDSVSLKKFEHTRYSKHLFVQNNTVANIIKLCAPNLEEFCWRSFFTQDYSLEICSPLSTVGFYMYLEENEKYETAEIYSGLSSEEKDVYAKRMMQFLGAVYMVKNLILSSGFVEVLSQAPGLLDCQPPRLHNLKHLTLEMWSTRGCMRAITYLLGISPNVEEVYLESKKSNLVDVGDNWEAGLSLPETLSHLKYVQIQEVEGCAAELKLLSFLFKNATVLEQVDFFFRSNYEGSCERKRQVKRFKDKLRALPTASPNIKLMF